MNNEVLKFMEIKHYLPMFCDSVSNNQFVFISYSWSHGTKVCIEPFPGFNGWVNNSPGSAMIQVYAMLKKADDTEERFGPSSRYYDTLA